MLTLYGFPASTRSNKVVMCANALGLDYRFVSVNLMAGEQYSPLHRKRHPGAKVPVMDDNGFRLFESHAIMKYLCRKTGSALYPRHIEQQALVDQWCDFIVQHIETHLSSLVFNQVLLPRWGKPVDAQALKEKPIALHRGLRVVEAQLSKGPYMVGQGLTIADISLINAIDPVEMIDWDLRPYPALLAWRSRQIQADYYQREHQYFGEHQDIQ